MAQDAVPLTIKEGSENNPIKPKTPSRVCVSEYVDGDAVIKSSTISVMAQVTVTDPMTGDCLFDRFVPLAPDYRCYLPNISGVMTLTINIGNKVYEGQFII